MEMSRLSRRAQELQGYLAHQKSLLLGPFYARVWGLMGVLGGWAVYMSQVLSDVPTPVSTESVPSMSVARKRERVQRERVSRWTQRVCRGVAVGGWTGLVEAGVRG